MLQAHFVVGWEFLVGAMQLDGQVTPRQLTTNFLREENARRTISFCLILFGLDTS
jgi:hypothetical protein